MRSALSRSAYNYLLALGIKVILVHDSPHACMVVLLLEQYLRAVAGPIGGLLGGLADNKKPMRDATISALQCAAAMNKGWLMGR